MQLRGWEPARASRIVIILLVVQQLGLGQILVVASTNAAVPDPPHGSWTVVPIFSVLPSAVVAVPVPGSSTTLDGRHSQPIPPDPALPLRWLPRAPPAG